MKSLINIIFVFVELFIFNRVMYGFWAKKQQGDSFDDYGIRYIGVILMLLLLLIYFYIKSNKKSP